MTAGRFAVALGLLPAALALPFVTLAALATPPGAGALGTLATTLVVAGGTTVVTLALALPAAVAVTRIGGGPALWFAATMRLLRLAPPFVAGLALVVGLGAAGLAVPSPGRGSPLAAAAAVMAAQAITLLPLAWLRLAEALARVPAGVEDVAETLGAGRLVVWRRITLPCLGDALRATAMLVLALAVADLANPLLVGADLPLLAPALLAAARAGDAGAAAALGALLVMVTAACVLLAGGRGAGRAPAPAVRGARRPVPVAARWGAVGLLAALALAALGVLALVGLGAVLAGAAIPRIAGAVVRSLLLGVIVAAAGTVAALALGYLARRAGACVGERLAAVPVAVPGVVVALGYALVLGAPAAPAWLLVLAIGAWALPAALAAGVRAFASLDRDGEEAALSLGAGRAVALARVVVPAAFPAAAGLFAGLFVAAVGTASIPLVLGAPDPSVAAAAAVAAARGGAPAAGCALAAAVALAGLGVAGLGRALGARDPIEVLPL